MILDQLKVSSLYAKTFIKTFYISPPLELLEKIKKLNFFLSQKHVFSLFLAACQLGAKKLNASLDQLVAHVGLSEPEKRFLFFLFLKKRGAYVRSTFKRLEKELERFFGKEKVFVYTSHPLSAEEKEKVVLIVNGIYSSQAIIEYIVDLRLIIGIRIVSPDKIWEISARKILQAFSLHLHSS